MRILAALLAAALALALAGCGDDEDAAGGATGASPVTTPTIPAPEEASAEPVVRSWLHTDDDAASRAVGLSAGTAARLAREGVPVPSEWRGEVSGTVYGRPFRLPLFISLYPRQTQLESSPIRVYMGNRAESALELGGFIVASAHEVRAPDGSPVTINYVDVEVDDGRVRGVLVNDARTIGAALNQFIAPNVTAMNAPDVYRPIAEALGPTEIFLFQPRRSRFELQVDGDGLEGSVTGTGSSLTGIFPLPEVRFEAQLAARRSD